MPHIPTDIQTRRSASLLADVQNRVDTHLATQGPTIITRKKRKVCSATMNGMSTGAEAAIMAMESTPPGLVARYAVNGSTPATQVRTAANPPHSPSSNATATTTMGSALRQCLTTAGVNRSPTFQPTTAKLTASNHGGITKSANPVLLTVAPSAIGSRSAPAGIRNRLAPTLPTATTAAIQTREDQAICGNHSNSGGGAKGPTHTLLTTAATSATITMREYCIIATSRASAPLASAINISGVAPPGSSPHIAVDPGSVLPFAMSTPKNTLAAITVTTETARTGQNATISGSTSGTILRAIMQPITPWAPMNKRGGMLTRQPRRLKKTAATRHPIKVAAGTCNKRIPSTTQILNPSSPPHCIT